MMKPFMMTTKFPTIILSNFPGPPVESKGVGGYPLIDAMFTGGPLPGNIGETMNSTKGICLPLLAFCHLRLKICLQALV